jgi:hypothetical protein
VFDNFWTVLREAAKAIVNRIQTTKFLLHKNTLGTALFLLIIKILLDNICSMEARGQTARQVWVRKRNLDLDVDKKKDTFQVVNPPKRIHKDNPLNCVQVTTSGEMHDDNIKQLLSTYSPISTNKESRL